MSWLTLEEVAERLREDPECMAAGGPALEPTRLAVYRTVKRNLGFEAVGARKAGGMLWMVPESSLPAIRRAYIERRERRGRPPKQTEEAEA